MFCQYCMLNLPQLETCPKCGRQMFDTCYTQFLISNATKTFTVDAAGIIYCIETKEPLIKPVTPLFTVEKKTREDWLAKKEREEATETQAINNYLSEYNNGSITADRAYFNTFKKVI